MLHDGRPFCDLCKHELAIVTEDEDGEELSFTHDIAPGHCCDTCWVEGVQQAYDRDDPCSQCRTEPCMKGRDCWYQPPFLRNLPYGCYFAVRVEVTDG